MIMNQKPKNSKKKSKKEDNAKDLEALRSKYGQEIDDFKKEVKNAGRNKIFKCKNNSRRKS